MNEILRACVSAGLVVFSVFMLMWKMRFAGRGKFFENYFSQSQTHSLKGMCAVFILFSHMCSYLAGTYPAFYIFKYMGAIMVAGFFLVSGYGLQYSVMNKEGYLKGFLRKRLPAIAVPYYIANIFYIVTNDMPKADIIKSIFGYTLWYVMAIAIFYIGFYICNRVFRKHIAAIAVTVFIAAYMVIMNRLGFGIWWYISSPSFLLGIWICQLKDRFTAFFQKHYAVKILMLAAVFAVTYIYYSLYIHDEGLMNPVVATVNTTVFSLLVAALSMKIQLGNPILKFAGKLSLELYITHALWIAWLRNGFWHDISGTLFDGDFMYMLGIIAGTVVMSVLINTVSGIILHPSRIIPHKKLEKSAKM